MTNDGFTALDTRAVHAGEPHPRIGGAVAMPIFQSATFLYGGEADYHAVRYARLNNTPNHEVLHARLSSLEGAETALVTASGMAAISGALLAVLRSGDHLLAVDCPYGGTRGFLTEDLPRWGIECTFIGHDDAGGWKAALRPETRAIYMETITNPLMRVPDLDAAVAFAREHGLVSMVDNTFASPVNYRPAEHGFDLSLHSCTKYLNGHGDITAGAVIGRAELVDGIQRLLNHLGGTLDPHACFLLERGIQTLGLRVRRQNDSALRIARFLEAHRAVVRVDYPGLASAPEHARARALLDGYGGVLSFEPAGGVEAAEAFLRRVRIATVAVSLGGVHSLAIRPAVTAYANVEPAERRRLGVSDSLLRLAVGVEDADELMEDLDRALV